MNRESTTGHGRLRPRTQGATGRRRRQKAVTIALPAVDTYRQHMDEAERVCRRLRLTQSAHPNSRTTTASLPTASLGRSHTFMAVSKTPLAPQVMPTVHQSRQVRTGRYGHCKEYCLSSHTEDSTQSNSRSPSSSNDVNCSESTGNCGSRRHGWTFSRTNSNVTVTTRGDIETEVTSFELRNKPNCDADDPHEGLCTPTDKYSTDVDGEGTRRESVGMLQLCEHLKTQGLGNPAVSFHSHTARDDRCLPDGVKARCLPCDPSTREKIKGRARLDYELAELRTVSFCAQQQFSALTTASAHLQTTEAPPNQEEREHRQLHKSEIIDTQPGPERDGTVITDTQLNSKLEETQNDEVSSLVGSPLSREELFLMIDFWLENVHKALHPGTSF